MKHKTKQIIQLIHDKRKIDALKLFTKYNDIGMFNDNTYIPCYMIKSKIYNENDVFNIYQNIAKDKYVFKAISWYIYDTLNVSQMNLNKILTDIKEYTENEFNLETKEDFGLSVLLQALVKMNRLDDVIVNIEWIQYNNIDMDVSLINKLLNIIGIDKRNVVMAEKLFNNILDKNQNIILFNSMMNVYMKQDQFNEIILLYQQLNDKGLSLTDISYNILFQTCSKLKNKELGYALYQKLYQQNEGNIKNVKVCNSMIEMFGNFGDIEMAKNIFDKVNVNGDIITFGAMMTAYNNCDCHNETLRLFDQLKSKNIKIDYVCYCLSLKAAANEVSIIAGESIAKHLFEFSDKQCIEHEFVQSSLINMYAKCGEYRKAIDIFNYYTNINRDIVVYNAILNCYAKIGDIKSMIQLFKKLQTSEYELNSTTYSVVINGCSHAGKIELAKTIFKYIENSKHLDSKIIATMVDCFGRKCELLNAEELLYKYDNLLIDLKDKVIIYTSLLSFCKKYNDLKIGKRIFDKLNDILKDNHESYKNDISTIYILMANMYANQGMIKESKRLHQFMSLKNIIKS